MVIVLDCPSCAKRYEVDAALAGKKSRCKQCGEVFKIPVPDARAVSQPPSAIASPLERFSTDVWDRPRHILPPDIPSAPRGSGGGLAPSNAMPDLAPKIVIHCPGCRKRYEVNCALAGKKSRCKDCGEVFLIPVPGRRENEPASAERLLFEPLAAPSVPPRPRANSPAPPAYWESVDEEVPTVFKANRSPAGSTYDEIDLPPPPRAGFAKPERSVRRPRDWGNNPDVGITFALFYVVGAIVVVVGFWIWTQAASPPRDRIGQIFAIISLLLHGTALLLSFAGNIWVLVIAFKEKMEQGLLCLLVPCYAFYYIFSRWEDTKGAFFLELLPVGNIVVVIVIGFAVGIVAGRNAADVARDGQAANGDVIARDNAPGPPAFGPPAFGPPAFGPRGGIGPRLGRPRNPAFDPRGKVLDFAIKHGERAVVLRFSDIPTNTDPAKGVTTRDVSEAIRARARELAPGATNFMWTRSNNRSAFALSPVDDAAELARKIDFGTATVRDEQTIDVVLSPDYIASVPRLPAEAPAANGNRGRAGRGAEPEIPAEADQVTRSLIQLKSPDTHTRKQAAQRLSRITPDERLAEVIAALLPQLENDDQWLVSDTIKALAVWKSPDAVPALIARTGDNRFLVRHEAIKALARINDPRAVEPILAQIKEDGFQVEDALKQMGSVAEPALIERLRDPDSRIRRRACVILKESGGRETLKAMQALPPDSDLSVRVAANDAVGSIVARVGPLPASERKGKSASSSSRRRGPG